MFSDYFCALQGSKPSRTTGDGGMFDDNSLIPFQTQLHQSESENCYATGWLVTRYESTAKSKVIGFDTKADFRDSERRAKSFWWDDKAPV